MKFLQDLGTKISNEAGKLYLKASKNSPTILLVGGIVTIAGATVMAIARTSKADDCMDEFQHNMDRIKENIEAANKKENPEQFYSLEEQKKDKQIVYGHMIMSMAKIYLPVILMETAGIFMICKSHQILSKRNAGLTAAYAALSTSFDNYRKRVAEKYGEEEERNLYYGFGQKTLTNTITGDNGVTTTETKEVKTADPLSPYSRFIDETSGVWERNPNYTLENILVQQRTANDLLWSRGFLTLNEAYRLLGLPQTTEGMVLGWIKDKDCEQKIDFGLYNIYDEARRRFINGYENVVLVDFNVDGNIYEMMKKERERNKLNG